MASSSSSSHGLLGQKLFEGKTRTTYAVNDQPSLICIHLKDFDDTSETLFSLSNLRRPSADTGLRFQSQQNRSQSSLEAPGRGTLSTSITTCVYEILREAAIPTFFVASHPQSNMFIAQKCTMIPIVWTIRRLADESYIKRHPNVTLGHRFLPVIVEISSSPSSPSPRRPTMSNLDEQAVMDVENLLEEEDPQSDERISPIYSYEQLAHTHLDLGQLKVTSMDLDYMYEVCLTAFDVLEHVWLTKKKYQLMDLKIEFGWTTAKEIVVANVYDIDTWHVLRVDGKQHSSEEELAWINNALREILDLNVLPTTVKNAFKSKARRSSSIDDGGENPKEPSASESNVTEPSSNGDEKESLSTIVPQPSIISRCIIVCSSLHDIEHGQKMKSMLSETYNIQCDVRLCSLYGCTQTVQKLLASYSYEHCRPTVFVTVSTVNSDLAMCLASNSPYPIIHCLPVDPEKINPTFDCNSFTCTETSLYTLVFTLPSAVHSVVQILAMHDWKLWAKQRGRRFKKYMDVILADQQLILTQMNKGSTGFSTNK